MAQKEMVDYQGSGVSVMGRESFYLSFFVVAVALKLKLDLQNILKKSVIARQPSPK